MPSVLALLSKSFFEKIRVDGAVPGLGDVAAIDRYLAKTNRFAALGSGDSLFLVTVRPPDEELWLVAVLENPTFEITHWLGARPNRTPVTAISDLITALTFDNGKALSTTPGRLGMSLQTPRVLTAADVSLIEARVAPPAVAATASPTPAGATGGSSADAVAERDQLLKALRATPEDAGLRERAARACIRAESPERVPELLAGHFIHLNAHDLGPLPCLCKACLAGELHAASTDGTGFVRDFAIAEGRILYFWLPETLNTQRKRVVGSVASNMRLRFRGGGR